MYINKKKVLSVLLVLIMTTSVFAFGKKDTGSSSSSSSSSLKVQTSVTYGPWLQGGPVTNTLSTPVRGVWKYSISYNCDVNASSGFSLYEIESSVGFKKGETFSAEKSAEADVPPYKKVSAMYRAVYSDYSVFSGTKVAGSAKRINDLEIVLY